jgi:hypothetical protein
MELKDFGLTEDDFKLIQQALDFLPNSGAAGELATEMLEKLLPDIKDRNAKLKYEQHKKVLTARREAEKELLIEKVRVLQGKLYQVKRYLDESGALKQANDILKGPPLT